MHAQKTGYLPAHALRRTEPWLPNSISTAKLCRYVRVAWHTLGSAVEGEALHQIGEVADVVGLSLRTVRYYEEQGLVRPARRTKGGFRLYRAEEIARLELIKQMKPLGFSIQEMRELLDAHDRLEQAEPGSAKHEEALGALESYAEATKQKIKELRKQLAAADVFTQQLSRELRRHRRRGATATSA
jgi:DNA-binding transcriptional MerR regulator